MISYKKFSGLEASQYRSNFNVLQNMDMICETILTCAWSPIVWKNNYAKTENFLCSYFLALDFDTPMEFSLEELNHSLQDHKRIIATTKSHQKVKNGVVCDRFRLVIPWDKPIYSYAAYRHNYELVLKKYPDADKKCLDGARFFFPCNKILYLDRDAIYCWETSEPSQSHTINFNFNSHLNQSPDGKIPPWCLNFINNGAVYNGSRNVKVYAVARELFRQGFSESSVRKLLMRSPIDWQGVGLESIIKSAKGKENGKTS